MKKILAGIIAIFISFSIQTPSFASNSIDELLELPYGPELHRIQLVGKLDNIVFINEKRQENYMDFVRVNEILRRELMRKYHNGDFEVSQMSGIIENYKNTVYYTNRVFYYLKLQEDGMSGDEIDMAIASAYSNIRVYYTRMKNIIKKSY
jgi:hypothetical protein